MAFHNYLNIKKSSLHKYDMVIFYGESGVGKSSYINYLKEENDIVVDEIWSLHQCLLLGRLVKRDATLFIASHLPIWCYFFYFIFYNIKFINLNENKEKIRFFLSQQGIGFTEESIDFFMKKYKGSYNDLKIIINEFPNQFFDRSFNDFSKSHRIEKNPRRKYLKS